MQSTGHVGDPANDEVAVETGMPSDILAHLELLGHRLLLLPYLDRTFGAAVAAGANKTDGSSLAPQIYVVKHPPTRLDSPVTLRDSAPCGFGRP